MRSCRSLSRAPALVVAVVCWTAPTPLASASEPTSGTAREWQRYLDFTELRHADERHRGLSSLEAADSAERSACLRELDSGGVCIWQRETLTDEGLRISIPDGMVHHWSAAVFLPGVELESVLRFVQDYDGSASHFTEVEASSLIWNEGDTFEIYLRLRRKKVITVHYETEHRVIYRRDGDRRASSTSVATKIREIDNAGKPNESEKPLGKDRGFLKAINSYWWFVETDEGTRVECESVSLSRSIPAAARWLIQNYVDSVPRESLKATLEPVQKYFSRSVSSRN